MILNQWRRRKAPLGRAVSTRIAGYVSRSSSTVSASLLTHLYAQPRFAASLSSEGLRSGSAMLPLLRSTLAAATLLLGVALVTGCSSEDPRLVADAKTCQKYGACERHSRIQAMYERAEPASLSHPQGQQIRRENPRGHNRVHHAWPVVSWKALPTGSIHTTAGPCVAAKFS